MSESPTSPVESTTASAEGLKHGELSGKADDPVIWLATVSQAGQPSIRPVWFVLHEGKLVTFSTPKAWKVRHVQANPAVSVTFHTDRAAKSVLVVTGRAEVTLEGTPPSAIPAYWKKYETEMNHYGYTPERFDELYPVRITITPDKSWGW
ncbi:pyridoxamine 5'-phosphate oxidase family protein [Parafrankia sp. EUN1f]|uniref:pyridoxamine 5'-phosphate oxidase family protein n=1 Tax=Parafrankia sp. EUN1f TaxID=102897 RepID=UPI0001C4422F|nr:pyridoxamine 5'-phosphate oxidase family protein [Parafrankia sp. EUN1f]EFC85791.1 pyridoxamine 5'-phosphate oxidase-related FMN-binding protein [Parafrankia sp. EUN1f]